MNPREFEAAVAESLRQQGYETAVGPYQHDFGIDIVAHRGSERVAVQVKMYGAASRHVSREAVMELVGAAKYADCTRAMLVTDGSLTNEARRVAAHVGVEIIEHFAGSVPHPPAALPRGSRSSEVPGVLDFETIWERYGMPMSGRAVTSARGHVNKIVRVDWTGVDRVTSTGTPQHISIEIFRFAVERLLSDGEISRAEINDHYPKRASSGIVAFLGSLPVFEVTERPTGLRLASVSRETGVTGPARALAPSDATGHATVRDLLGASSLPIPPSPGIYIIKRTAKGKPTFRMVGTGGRFGGRDPNVAVSVLTAKWVPGAEIVYVGRASVLHDRVALLLAFGTGKPVAHWGGRYLWQLEDALDLRVEWRADVSPATAEAREIAAFVARWGALPFANLRR